MKNFGFTLIETLVVIAIVVALAAIAFPVFSAAKSRAHVNTCIHNLKQIGVGIELYAVDFHDALPYACDPYTQIRIASGEDIYSLLSEKARKAPSIVSTLGQYGVPASNFRCPLDCFFKEGEWSCDNNYFQKSGTSYQYDGFNAINSRKLSELPQPSTHSLMYDYERFHSRDISGHVSTLFADSHVKQVPFMDAVSGMRQLHIQGD